MVYIWDFQSCQKSVSDGVKQLFTLVLWETDGQGRLCDFLLKQVLLVQEEDDGGLNEPFVVTDGVKEFHAFDHSVHLLVFGQYQVIPWKRH